MSNLKSLLKNIATESPSSENELEVYADSIRQGLDLAAKELGIDISMLDYEVAQRGNSGLFGFGRVPYKLYVRALSEQEAFADLNDLDQKLSKNISDELSREFTDPNAPGTFKVRVTKSGIWFTVKPPKGKGRKVSIADVAQKMDHLQIKDFNQDLVKKSIAAQSGKPVRIGEWVPNIELDGTMYIEISDDEMYAMAHFEPPRFSGRHMELDDVLHSLKNAGVVVGIDEEAINKYLDEMNYSSPLVAAAGVKPKNGTDAYVEYKVRVEKEISFDNDDDSVDFKDLNLIENVVVGQLLAVKRPATNGVEGRTVKNNIIPVRPGKDIAIKHGEGTILSDDGMELTAERNGQVILKGDKICVDEVLLVQGDVNNVTGNIVMMGSVVITGNVLDEFSVKASGNVEVRGSVQKAVIEAEGDIVIRQGINGRDEGRIETTSGSIYAKFVNRANLIAEKNVVVTEELLQSRVDAGGTVFCNGRRAQIVGGVIRAGDEVNAKQIGSDSYTKTFIYVGMNPKVLQQMNDLSASLDSTAEELEKLELDIKTLTSRKKRSRLSEEQEEKLQLLTDRQAKLTKRHDDIVGEREELEQYLDMLEHKGIVCAEKQLYPGVEIIIKNERLPVQDPYSNVSISMKDKSWVFGNYIKPDSVDTMTSSSRRRR
ncbi:MAG: FapA family protein [Spirochaetes bacterium]|nr:FapA family protein [Spirochaetota bacterium]MBN2770902.1 FapA family protein [Spirochaetota bacterium]